MVQYPNIEFKYNKGRMMRGQYVLSIQKRLVELKLLNPKYADGIYGPFTEAAVKKFQKSNKMVQTGVVNKTTWDLLFANTNNKNTKTTTNSKSTKTTSSNNKTIRDHTYDKSYVDSPFFNKANDSNLKKTDLEITIQYGYNGNNKKTIKHVFLRSVGQEIDASGNPIYDVYEFVGQDIVE